MPRDHIGTSISTLDRSKQTTCIGQMLFQCWVSVFDAEPASKQHWVRTLHNDRHGCNKCDENNSMNSKADSPQCAVRPTGKFCWPNVELILGQRHRRLAVIKLTSENIFYRISKRARDPVSGYWDTLSASSVSHFKWKGITCIFLKRIQNWIFVHVSSIKPVQC